MEQLVFLVEGLSGGSFPPEHAYIVITKRMKHIELAGLSAVQVGSTLTQMSRIVSIDPEGTGSLIFTQAPTRIT